MTELLPRLRMFAGPNGSGKTTIKTGLERTANWFGTYINPDDIEKHIRETGRLSLAEFDLSIEIERLRQHFSSSSLLRERGSFLVAEDWSIESDAICFPSDRMDSYVASVLSDFMRRTALAESKSFSFETVMSSPDKVEFLKEAQARGFRTYLYFVATEDPLINIERVRYRVEEGGHDVPRDKIISRYRRSIDLLREAIRHANRGFLFDTSGEAPWYFAETTDGSAIELKSESVPNWFRPIWDDFG